MTKGQSVTEPATKFVAEVEGLVNAAATARNHLARFGQPVSSAETAFSAVSGAKSSLFERFFSTEADKDRYIN